MVAPHKRTVQCFIHGPQETTSCVIGRCPVCEREEFKQSDAYKEFMEMLKNLPEDGEG